jgi:hypothetical protein
MGNFDLFKKLQLVRAVNMLNHIGILHHYFAKRLPPLPLNYGQGLVVTRLNIFCLRFFLRVSLVAINGGLFFGGVSIICWTLRFSSRQTNKIKKEAILACLIAMTAAYFAQTGLSNTRCDPLVWNKLISSAAFVKSIVF